MSSVPTNGLRFENMATMLMMGMSKDAVVLPDDELATIILRLLCSRSTFPSGAIFNLPAPASYSWETIMISI